MFTRRSLVIAAIIAVTGCEVVVDFAASVSRPSASSTVVPNATATAAPVVRVTTSPTATAAPEATQSTTVPTVSPPPLEAFRLFFYPADNTPEGLVVSKGDPIVVGRWRIVSTHDFHLARLAYRLDRSSRVLMNLVFDINGVEIFEIVAGAVVYEVFYEIEPYTQELIKGGKFSELTATVRTIQNLPVDVRAYMDITGIRFPGASESIDPGIPYVGGKSVNIAI